MSYDWSIPLVGALLNLLLGIFVWLRGVSLSNAYFALSLGLTVWNLDLFVLFYAGDPADAHWFSVFLRIGQITSLTLGLRLTLLISAWESLWTRLLMAASLASCALLLFLNYHGDLVSGVRPHPWGYYPVGTKWYALFVLSIVFHSCAILGVALRTLWRGAGYARYLARLWLLGAVIGLSFGMTNLLPVLGIHFYPLGSLGTVAFAGVIGYGIARHSMFDIELVVTRGASTLAGILLVIVPLFVLFVWTATEVHGQLDLRLAAVVLGALVTVALIYPRFAHAAQERLYRSVFRERYEYRNVLRELGHSLAAIPDSVGVARKVCSTLCEALELAHASVWVLNHGECAVLHSLGTAPRAQRLPAAHPLLLTLRGRRHAVLRTGFEVGDGGLVRDFFVDNALEICVPLNASGRQLGMLCLGPNSERSFAASDLQVLETVADACSLALAHAALVAESGAKKSG